MQNISVPFRRLLAYMLMAASGTAGLGYQIIWTQQSALWLGHEATAVLAVVAAFFGGLATGALLLGKRIEHSKCPGYWYVGCEAIISLWSGLLIVFMPVATHFLLDIQGLEASPFIQWGVAFMGVYLLLLPATAAMGATLPAIERLSAELSGTDRSIAGFYAANTIGAVIGVITAAYWAIPTLGLMRSTFICVALNFFCAVSSFYAFGKGSESTSINYPVGKNNLSITLFLTGLLGIAYEVLVVRILSQVTEDTVYTFAMLLAVYLVGTALGASIYRNFKRWITSESSLTLIYALATACCISGTSLWGAETLKAFALNNLGSGIFAAMGSEALLAIVAFGLPTLIMGALFSHLSDLALRQGITFGRALGINTLGAALAPLLFALLMLAEIQAKWILLAIVMGYWALAAMHDRLYSKSVLPILILVAVAIWVPPLRFVDIPANGNLISYREGILAAVSVVEDAEGVARLRINNRQQEGSSATVLVDSRQALLPILLHPKPSKALFLGLGTGVTASAAAADPNIGVDAAELLPEVIEASAYFRNIVNSNASPNLKIIAADARRYVKTTLSSYDVIVSDNFHPARSGSGSLYTVEHFTAVKARLNADGLFCQWLPLHQLDLDSLRSIINSFIAVYPGALAILASNSVATPVIGLVGRKTAKPFDLNQITNRLQTVSLPTPLADFGLNDEYALLGSIISGSESLRQFALGTPMNTDDQPVVAYRAPLLTYNANSLPIERLLVLLRTWYVQPDEVLASNNYEVFKRRLRNYGLARQQYIELGQHIQPSSNPKSMLAQIGQPLLDILKISPDFRPAYDPLVNIAFQLRLNDPDASRAWLSALAQIQPNRPEAIEGLRLLDSPQSR